MNLAPTAGVAYAIQVANVSNAYIGNNVVQQITVRVGREKR
jgi:hypothetical protein